MSCYRDLNPGPLPYQGSALPLSYNSKENKSCGQRWIRTTEGVSQQIYSLPHLATLVFAPTLQKELFSLLNHRRVNFTRTISVLISSPPREERLIPLILERASCRIRTNDPEITNHVLWPTELKRQINFTAAQSPRLSGCKVRYNFLITKYFSRFFYLPCCFSFAFSNCLDSASMHTSTDSSNVSLTFSA